MVGAAARRAGFTLLELLVVLFVIMLLMGLVVTGVQFLREQAKKTRTRSVLAMVTNAMAAAGATQAQNLDTVEHPLAASASDPAPRPLFVRAADGTPVATTGEAIVAPDAAFVALGDRSRMLLADDVHADPGAPHLFGLPRWRIAVAGVTTRWVSRWRRISGPGQAGTLVEPELATWTDEGFIRETVTDPDSALWDRSADKAMAVALGATQDELLALGALWRPDPARDPLIAGKRLRRDASPGVPGPSDRWAPGTVRDGEQWVRYRIRGPSIVDAWGREILVATTSRGALRLESAGRDGCFRWHPGQDGSLQTDPRASAAAGDDRDGRADNIALGPQE